MKKVKDDTKSDKKVVLIVVSCLCALVIIMCTANSIYKLASALNNNTNTMDELLEVLYNTKSKSSEIMQQVLDSNDQSLANKDLLRRQSLALSAQTAIEAANTYFMNKSLSQGSGYPTENGKTNCVSVKTLKEEGYLNTNGIIEGKVVVEKLNDNYLFTVYIHKDELMVNGRGVTGYGDNRVNTPIKATTDATSDVVSYDSGSFNGVCN